MLHKIMHCATAHSLIGANRSGLYGSPPQRPFSTHDLYAKFKGIDTEIKRLLPTVNMPFERRINPHYAAAKTAMDRWVQDYDLASQNYPKFQACDYPLLGALCHPDVSKDNLSTICCFMAWLFAHDDHRDAPQTSEHPTSITDIVNMNAHLTHILNNERIPTTTTADPVTHKLGQSLIDLLTQLQDTQRDLSPFKREFKLYLSANLFETRSRQALRSTDISEYCQFRQYTSAVYPAFEMGYLFQPTLLNKDFRDCSIRNRIKAHGNLAICLFNDIVSDPKELTTEQIPHLV
ncbi:MAG: terpene synthase family protein [Candidatus Marinamargulisbacteria bacterium]